MTERVWYIEKKTSDGAHPEPAHTEILIFRTLLYFSIFRYPLTENEITQYLGQKSSIDSIRQILDNMVMAGKIYKSEIFYSIEKEPELALRRKNANSRAAAMIQKAIRTGRFLYQFPFVKGVGISGSLSKNVAEDKADFDFFIITKANRLWVARTLMHLYKKFTFLTGRHHHYCMNYYVDEHGLLLDKQNIFTATELKTLLPVAGKKVMQVFFATNNWADGYLPACNNREQASPDPMQSWIKRFGQWAFSGKVGDKLDNYLFKLTTHRWNKKSEKGKKNNKGIRMGLDTGKHFARSNPGGLQEKILVRYEEGLRLLGIKPG